MTRREPRREQRIQPVCQSCRTDMIEDHDIPWGAGDQQRHRPDKDKRADIYRQQRIAPWKDRTERNWRQQNRSEQELEYNTRHSGQLPT